MIGYYVHHHGSGHLHRALAVLSRLAEPATILSSLPRPPGWSGPWVDLPRDDTDLAPGTDPGTAPADTDTVAGGTLHWAPLHHPGLRERMRRIADWLGNAAPSLLVVDVSVEVAVLARLHGVPVACVAMRGDRSDRPHQLAYDLAGALLAPWAAEFAEPGWPARWRDKTQHTGAFSRFDHRPQPPAPPGWARPCAVVMLGTGGTEVTTADLDAAMAATPDWRWQVLGSPGHRHVDDPWPMLCAADVVITHAGDNAVAEVAAARRPTVVLPQSRPHGEQLATAQVLRRAGLAVVREHWPTPEQWPACLDQARRLGGHQWHRWSPGDGADAAARFIQRSADAASNREGLACAPR